MTHRLLPCPECGRHAKSTEASCPFCGAAVAAAFARIPEARPVPSGLSRTALLALAATTVNLSACGEVRPHYGAPDLWEPPPEEAGTGSGGDVGQGKAMGGTGGAGMGGRSSGGTGSGGVASGDDAGPDSGPMGAGGTTGTGGGAGTGGPVPVPPYGAPIPFYGAPSPPGKPGIDS